MGSPGQIHGPVLSHRNVTLDPGTARDFTVTMRAAHAFAGGAEAKSMISTLDNIADETPQMQWSEPMGASVGQRDDFVGRSPVEQQRF